MNAYIQRVLDETRAKNANEPEFLQTVEEVLTSLEPVINAHPEYEAACLLERMVEPERTIEFRVVWMDDQLKYHVNRGYRVQYNAALGPYKGGLRFASNVNLSIIKFLGFEQTFKDALTCLPIGGAKGGSDFSPIGRSDGEVMRFCQAFMTEFHRHIGQDIDCPAGDVGVGGREVGYLYGQYRRIVGAAEFGAMSGKAVCTGGSILRPEATGYGDIYFAENMLAMRGETFEGKKCVISGAGNVASFAAQKLMQLGAKVLTLSDRSGAIYCKDGLTEEMLQEIMVLKNVTRGELADFAKDKAGVAFYKGANSWQIADQIDCAFPCARQNELNGDDAAYLLKHGCTLVGEGANMPSTPDAIEAFVNAKIMYSPGKASNAGGVATSGLEMSQNSIRMSWSFDEVDEKLHGIMQEIYKACYDASVECGKPGDLMVGANVAGFLKVADAMMAQGIV